MTIVVNPNANTATATGSAHASPITVTISSVTAGNTIIVCLVSVDSGSTLGNGPPAAPTNYVTDISQVTVGTAGSQVSTAIYRRAAAPAGANAISIPISYGTSPWFWEIVAFEVTPVTLDKHPTAVSSTTTTLVGPNTGTLTQAIELVVANCGADSTGAAGIPPLPGGFTSLFGDNASGLGQRACYQITSATTALNPSWSSTSATSMGAGIATYTDATASGTSQGIQPGIKGPGVSPDRRLSFAQRPLSTVIQGANLTLGLTGQAATLAAGVLAEGVAVAALGQAATFAAGTLSIPIVATVGRPLVTGPGISPDYLKMFAPVQLAGVVAQTSNVTVGLTGQAATFAAGALIPGLSLTLIGTAATFAAGTVLLGASASLTGQAATFASGALTPSLSVALLGQGATFTAGTVSVSVGGNLTIGLTGQSATFTAGTLVPSVTIAQAGQGAALSAGALAPALGLGVSGAAATFAAGTLVYSRALALSGQVGTFAPGNVGANIGGNVTLTLSGQVGTFAQGALGPSLSVGLLGQRATFAPGTVVALSGFSLALTGISATFASGTVSQQRSNALLGIIGHFTQGIPSLLNGVLFGGPRYIVKRAALRKFKVERHKRAFTAKHRYIRPFTVSATTMLRFDDIEPGESWPLTFDFTPDLATGETLASIVSVTWATIVGIDANPSAQLNGSAGLDSTSKKVIVPVKASAINGNDYQITVTTTTSNAQKGPILVGVLPVRL